MQHNGIFTKICPHQILGMSRPKDDFTGKKLDVSYFKIFGSSVYVHVRKDARKKLEPTIEIGIFLGTLILPTTMEHIFQTTG